MCLVASIPFIVGILMPINTKSGFSAGVFSTASFPFPAGRTLSRWNAPRSGGIALFERSHDRQRLVFCWPFRVQRIESQKATRSGHGSYIGLPLFRASFVRRGPSEPARTLSESQKSTQCRLAAVPMDFPDHPQTPHEIENKHASICSRFRASLALAVETGAPHPPHSKRKT